MGELIQPMHFILLLIPVVLGIFLLPGIFYVLTLQNTLKQCSPASRTLEPGMTWLYLVPLVNIVFHFFIVFGIAKSLRNEFDRRGIPCSEPLPGQSIGLAMCICACCTVIPLLGLLAAIAHVVLWIVYWVKVAEFSRMLVLNSYSQGQAPGLQTF